MPVELFDQIITDFFSHANSFDNVFSTLDKDLNNLNAFTYHRISLVHVNKYEDVVVAHDTRGDDLFQKKTLFVVDADHQLNIIGVDPIIPGDDAGVVLNYYLQELKIVDDSQRELRFHLGRMENTYQIWFKHHLWDYDILRYTDNFKKRYSMYLQMWNRFNHAVRYRHVIEPLPVKPDKNKS